MKIAHFSAVVASLSLIAVFPAYADDLPLQGQFSTPTVSDLGTVAPALERYTRDALFDSLWQHPELSPRDRSLVTLAVLITRDQTALLPPYLKLALDSGVKPGEISETITHLAFYAGWGNAV